MNDPRPAHPSPSPASSHTTAPTLAAPPARSAPPPHGPRLRVLLTLILVAILALLAGVRWHQPMSDAATRAARFLASLTGGEPPTDHDHPADIATQYYTCGMHPWVILPSPGDCPICHMKLTPLDAAKFTGEIAIDPLVTQNIGVRIAPVRRGLIQRSIRTVGTVTADPTRVRDAVVRADGQVRRLVADYPGKPVQQGQTLADIDSPEVLAAGHELAAALRAGVDASIVEAARQKLRALGVPDTTLDDITRTGRAPETFPVVSPIAGVVSVVGAPQGAWLMRGQTVATIVDLSHVWIDVAVYEHQLPGVRVGQAALLRLPFAATPPLQARVTYIYPELTEQSRQARVRVEFDNPADHEPILRPGMFVSVDIQSPAGEEQTIVPREAVIDTGLRQVAFVSLGEGRFEPRQVRLGATGHEGEVEILEGLSPGENVVVSGQFLLDSEARIRESLAKMIRGTPAIAPASTAPAPAPATPTTPAEPAQNLTLPAPAQERLASALRHYFTIASAMAGDGVTGVEIAAHALADDATALAEMPVPGDPHFWHTHPQPAGIARLARTLAGQSSLDEARRTLSSLSLDMAALVRAAGVPASLPHGVEEMHCPMYPPGEAGAIWLQPAGSPRNPYFGSKMLGCIDRKSPLPRSAPPTP